MRDAPGQAEIAETLVRNYEETLRSPQVELRLGTAPDVDRVGGPRPRPRRRGDRGGAVPRADSERGHRAAASVGRPARARVRVDGWSSPTGAATRPGSTVRSCWPAPGCEVTLTVAATAVGESLHSYRRALYLARLYRAGVSIRHHLRLVEVTPEGGLFANLFADDVREQIAADHVVLAQGRVPAASPSARLRELGLEVRDGRRLREPTLARRGDPGRDDGRRRVGRRAAGGRHAPAVQTA